VECFETVICILQVRRKMEDENRKSRRVARREYLDNVRELVAFVKKRDKRVAKAQVRNTLCCYSHTHTSSFPSCAWVHCRALVCRAGNVCMTATYGCALQQFRQD
jgi:hypothetical protein